MACKSKHMAALERSYFNGLEFTIHSWLVVHQKPAGAICPATTFNCEVPTTTYYFNASKNRYSFRPLFGYLQETWPLDVVTEIRAKPNQKYILRGLDLWPNPSKSSARDPR